MDRILQARLRAALGQSATEAGADGHLDADRISGFAEHALAGDERAAALAHLAACAHCRNVLSLAAAEAVPRARRVTTLITPPIWMGALAAAASIGAVAIWLSRPPKSPGPVGAPRPAPVLIARNDALERTLAPQPPANAVKAVPRSKPKRTLPMAAARPPVFASSGAPGDAGKNAGKKELFEPAAGATGSLKAFPAPAKVMQMQRALQTADSQALTGAISPSQFAANQLRARADASQMGYQAYPSSAIWTIDSPGNQVQRSLDNGKTWEPVRIADRINFQSVATSGTHIWAGGDAGALYYSADSGGHWERVMVADGESQLTGAITGIDAPTPGQVRVTTAAGEQWVSTDSGLHWTRKI
jgi:hypothetical protein